MGSLVRLIKDLLKLLKPHYSRISLIESLSNLPPPIYGGILIPPTTLLNPPNPPYVDLNKHPTPPYVEVSSYVHPFNHAAVYDHHLP